MTSETTLPFDIRDARLAHAAWSRIAEPGDLDAHRLIAAVGASEALAWLVSAQPDRHRPGLQAAVARWRPRLARLDPRRELTVIERLGGRLVTRDDPHWPARLEDLGDGAPHCLWLLGERPLDALTERSVAIVGTRAPTAYGEHVAADLAGQLSERGLTVVSGGAYGIDAVAHRAALAAGPSVAVQAGGLDRLYPKGNEQLLRRMQRDGALVAEVPPGSAPARFRFLQRNRIIAALAQATIVVEAAWRSGAQNTARHAAELLRPVGAVPGPITSAASAGCHRLIREGVATVIGSADEACELLAADPVQGELPVDDLGSTEARVLHALPLGGAVPGESVARTAGLAPADVLAALGRLELSGLAEQHDGRWRRAAG